MLDRRERQRREQRLGAEQLHPTSRCGTAFVEATEARPREDRGDREDRSGDDQRTLGPDPGDERWRDQPAERRTSVGGTVDETEDGDPRCVRGHPLDQGEPGDIKDGIADADGGHGAEGHDRIDDQAHHRDRRPPARERDRERRTKALAARERDRGDRPEQAAQTHHRVERSHARVARVRAARWP